MKLLVVDWDFFFPRPPESTAEAFYHYDWGHAESLMFIDYLWPSRGAAFLRSGLELPDVQGWQDFWPRVKLSKSARIYTAESNSAAVNRRIERGVDEVWLLDAHHDSGYSDRAVLDAMEKGRWTCENWLLMYYQRLGADRVHVRYPLHRSEAFTEEPETPWTPDLDRKFYDPAEALPTFNKVFACRSGAWVPSWCDPQFSQFVALANRKIVELRPLVERYYDPAAVAAEIELWKTLNELQKTLDAQGRL